MTRSSVAKLAAANLDCDKHKRHLSTFQVVYFLLATKQMRRRTKRTRCIITLCSFNNKNNRRPPCCTFSTASLVSAARGDQGDTRDEPPESTKTSRGGRRDRRCGKKRKSEGRGKAEGLWQSAQERRQKKEEEEIRREWRGRSEGRGGKMWEEQRERKSSLRALKPVLCTVMSDSVCRVNSPKPRDGGSTQHKHKPKGRKTRAKPLCSARAHTHRGATASAK